MSVYKRGRVYWVRFQWRGQEIRRSAHTTVRRQAEAFEASLKEECAQLDRGGRIRRGYDDMMARFFDEHLPTMKPGAAQRYIVSARSLNEHFSGMGLEEISRASVADYIQERRKEVSDATIRRDLACLSSALSCAVDWDWIDHNVMRSIRKRSLKEAAPRTRWLRHDEYQRILAVAPEDLSRVAVILVETGMRLGELLSLEWRNVSAERREVYLVGTKTGTDRTVPLSDAALAAISGAPRHIRCPLVIHTRNGNQYLVTGMSARLRRLFAKAEVEDFKAHDLRHTFASWYLQRGGRLDRLREILGHSRIEQTMKYAHLSTADLHDDLHRVGTKSGTSATDSAQDAGDEIY